jgi:hypothetical protein
MLKAPKPYSTKPGFNSSDTRFEVKILEKMPGPLTYNIKQSVKY